MSTLQSQLLPYERADIRALGREFDLESPIEESLARRWNCKDGHRSPERAEKLLGAWSHQYPHWTPDQVRTALSFHFVREGVGLALATARRILKDDPAELATGVCLEGRLEWVSRRMREQSGEGTADDDLGLIPYVMGVRDVALAGRLLEPRPAAKDRTEVADLLARAGAAAFRRDREALAPVVDRLRRRKVDRSARWLVGCLQGIAEGSRDLVAASLQQSLDEESRARARKEAKNIIGYETHCYYRLAEWVSPELVAGFDVTQPLPWDAGLHAWTETHPDPLASLDLTRISPILHEAVVDLRLPPWWRVLAEPERPEDPCRLVLQSVGPNPRQVREIVESFCGVRKWPAVDLGRCPVGVGAEMPRATAFQMRRRLLEAGASADFERVPGSPPAGEEPR